MLQVMKMTVTYIGIVILTAMTTAALTRHIYRMEKIESLKIGLSGDMIVLNNLKEEEYDRATHNLMISIRGQYKSLKSLGFRFGGAESTSLLNDSQKVLSEDDSRSPDEIGL